MSRMIPVSRPASNSATADTFLILQSCIFHFHCRVLMFRHSARLVFKKWAVCKSAHYLPGPGTFSCGSGPHAPWPCVTVGCLIHCVFTEWRTMLVYPAPVPHTWLGPQQLWGVFVVWWGSFAPASLIHDPFFYTAVDTNPPLSCTTWNDSVSGFRAGIHPNKEDSYMVDMHFSTRLIPVDVELSDQINPCGQNIMFITYLHFAFLFSFVWPF